MIKFRNAIKEIAPYVPGKPIEDVEREYGIKNVIKLASNENPFGSSEKVKNAINNAMNFNRLYPDGNCTNLRNKLSEKLKVNGKNLIFGCGTDELITLIGRSIINEGDEAITAEISFNQYSLSVKAMAGKMVYSKMKNYSFDLDDILEKITDKTKIIFIANPNNPTGTVFLKKQQDEFLKKVPKEILVVLDEAYAEFVTDENYPNTISLINEYENLVLLKTFSKAYGLAGLRIGYGIANENIITNFEKIRNPFNVNTLAQYGVVAAIDDDEFLNKTLRNNEESLKFLYDELDKLNLFYIKTHANFIMIDVKKDSNIIFEKLLKKGYIIRPGVAFKMNTFLRVSIGTLEEMKGFIEALKEVIK